MMTTYPRGAPFYSAISAAALAAIGSTGQLQNCKLGQSPSPPLENRSRHSIIDRNWRMPGGERLSNIR
jgi:hypothetical protein